VQFDVRPTAAVSPGSLTSAFTVISGPVRCVGTAGFEPATP